MIKEALITVTGIVQGVGFRPFVYRTAVKMTLNGYVKNRGDAVVEILVQGEEARISSFIEVLKMEKPPQARIDVIEVFWRDPATISESFKIVESDGVIVLSGSVIPPDISICTRCENELREHENKRHEYFFITCVDCGPRFTIINHLPYDRPNTVMDDFIMCSYCKREYTDPLNRRFHAQTVACPECGPKAFLTDNRGKAVESDNPVQDAGKLICEGFILGVKGYGGFHVATATTLSEPIAKLRMIKHRAQKPLAIMARSLNDIKSFALVNKIEDELLTSHIRPIVLLKKKENFSLSSLISPGLHSVGVMLPYTGLHMMLFDFVDEPAFVMTSGNPPGEPIVKDNEEALKALGDTVDYFLFHNRRIAHRCDDSVARVNDGAIALIRRSRGYAPAPIHLELAARNQILGLGGELNVTACILAGKKAFLTQHIGDMGQLETLFFLKNAVEHLIYLTNTRFEAVVCDLHPTMVTSKLAKEMGEAHHIPVIKIQHHHAHAVALMAEHGLDEIITVVCDGVGYGSDGMVWGGEILFSNTDGYKRLAHLEMHPMVGGDLASIYPLRMAVGILHPEEDIRNLVYSKLNHFPKGPTEAELILNQLSKGVDLKTSSCGRVLDAVSSILGLCYERTYEGEPAMKLESAACKGVDVLKLEPKIHGTVIETKSAVAEVFSSLGKYRTSDLAYSFEEYLARSLAEVAIQEAIRMKVKHIGFTGGVAYNEHIARVLRTIIEFEDLKLLSHRHVPYGDGGISLGQVVAADMLLK